MFSQTEIPYQDLGTFFILYNPYSHTRNYQHTATPLMEQGSKLIKFPADSRRLITKPKRVSKFGHKAEKPVEKHSTEVKKASLLKIKEDFDCAMLPLVEEAQPHVGPYNTSADPLTERSEINSRPPRSTIDPSINKSTARQYFVFTAIRQDTKNPKYNNETAGVPVLSERSKVLRNLDLKTKSLDQLRRMSDGTPVYIHCHTSAPIQKGERPTRINYTKDGIQIDYYEGYCS